MDIVELEGKLAAKRGKLGGKKQVWRCSQCLTDVVLPFAAPQPKCMRCGGDTQPMLRPLIKNGKLVTELPRPSDIRQYVLEQVEKLSSLGKSPQ
jgi:nicotinate phosphoribosyltransferase